MTKSPAQLLLCLLLVGSAIMPAVAADAPKAVAPKAETLKQRVARAMTMRASESAALAVPSSLDDWQQALKLSRNSVEGDVARRYPYFDDVLNGRRPMRFKGMLGEGRSFAAALKDVIAQLGLPKDTAVLELPDVRRPVRVLNPKTQAVELSAPEFPSPGRILFLLPHHEPAMTTRLGTIVAWYLFYAPELDAEICLASDLIYLDQPHQGPAAVSTRL